MQEILYFQWFDPVCRYILIQILHYPPNAKKKKRLKLAISKHSFFFSNLKIEALKTIGL